MKRQRGFTLIEVLLATVLLAGGLLLAFATIRSAMTLTARGETMAKQGEQARAVEGFLRRRLSSAMPVALGVEEQSGNRQFFIGEEQRLRFVADVPDYLGRGGPYLHDLAVTGDGKDRRMELSLTLVQDAKLIPEQPARGPEVLLDGVRSVRFRYRGADSQSGQLGEWKESWDATDRLPLIVSIEVVPEKGAAWPPLVVTLPQYRPAGVAQ